MIAKTSLLAYAKVLETLSKRQSEVYIVIRRFKSCNNQMICKELALPINSITGRVYELRKKGVVKEDKKDICPYTNEMTSYWKVVKAL